jgi:hypothetical protein
MTQIENVFNFNFKLNAFQNHRVETFTRLSDEGGNHSMPHFDVTIMSDEVGYTTKGEETRERKARKIVRAVPFPFTETYSQLATYPFI